MPIMLAIYSTSRIIVLKRYDSEQQKGNKQTNTHKQTNIQSHREKKEAMRNAGGA